MPQVARFTVIPESDNAVTLPGTIGDVHFQGFQAPGIDPSSHAVLAFRVNPKGSEPVTLRIRLQNSASNKSFEVKFTSDAHRSWHEIIAPGALAAQGNELVVSATGPGSLEVSDFFFLYRANI